MKTIKNKTIDYAFKLKSNTIYNGCEIYLDEHVEILQNTGFRNCTFHNNSHFILLDNVVFSFCNFKSELRINYSSNNTIVRNSSCRWVYISHSTQLNNLDKIEHLFIDTSLKKPIQISDLYKNNIHNLGNTKFLKSIYIYDPENFISDFSFMEKFQLEELFIHNNNEELIQQIPQNIKILHLFTPLENEISFEKISKLKFTQYLDLGFQNILCHQIPLISKIKKLQYLIIGESFGYQGNQNDQDFFLYSFRRLLNKKSLKLLLFRNNVDDNFLFQFLNLLYEFKHKFIIVPQDNKFQDISGKSIPLNIKNLNSNNLKTKRIFLNSLISHGIIKGL